MNQPERFVLTSMDVARVDGYRAQHRISLLTVLFSDIVGYTNLCEQLPEFEMLRVRSDFDALSADCVEHQYAGLLIKRMGDAILAIFAEPSTAVLAAIHLHETISKQTIAGVQLQLRTGIHLGQVAVAQSGTQIDVFGRHVNRAARVQSAADPGEILVTEPVEDNVSGWIQSTPENQLRFSRRRTLLLKGLEDPVTVFTVSRQAPTAPRQIDSRDPEVFIELRGVEGRLSGWAGLFDAAFDRRIIIGRDPACTVVINEPNVSRQQSIIWCDHEGYWTLIYLGTPHYGLTDGPVPGEPLKPGDRLRFGSCLLEVARLRHRKQ